MASLTSITHSQLVYNKPKSSNIFNKPQAQISWRPISSFSPKKAARMVVVSAMEAADKPNKRYPGETKDFVEEMKFVAIKMHTRDQAKEGEMESKDPPLAKWKFSVDGYLKFLVESRLVFGTLESIVEKAAHPEYAEFRNTGLERSERLAKDLEWFKQQGYTIPEVSSSGVSFAKYLEELSESDTPAFICHFYNKYFAHSAGGSMIGKKVSEKILDGRVLEFYKWEGDLSQILLNVRGKLNKIAEGWTREQKDHCLEETDKSFKHSVGILRLLMH